MGKTSKNQELKELIKELSVEVQRLSLLLEKYTVDEVAECCGVILLSIKNKIGAIKAIGDIFPFMELERKKSIVDGAPIVIKSFHKSVAERLATKIRFYDGNNAVACYGNCETCKSRFLCLTNAYILGKAEDRT